MSSNIKRWYLNDGSGSSEPAMYASKSGEYILVSDHKEEILAIRNTLNELIDKRNATIRKLHEEIGALKRRLLDVTGQPHPEDGIEKGHDTRNGWGT